MFKLFPIIFIFCGFWAASASEKSIKIGYIEFPPIFYTNKAGQTKGQLFEITKTVAKEAGYEPLFYSFPTKRMTNKIVTGELDLWVGLSTLPEFKGTTYIGKTSVFSIFLNAYFIGPQPPIVNKEDLVGKKIIIINGFSYGGWVNFILDPQNRVDILAVNSHFSALKALKSGRKDYLLNYEGPVQKTLKDYPVPNLNHNKITSLNAHFVVSKKAKNAKVLLADLESAFKAINNK